MFKAMIMLTRSADMSHEDFKAWWIGEHQLLAKQLPGVQKIRFNVVEQDETAPCDGIAELWFESQEAFIEAYATEIGKAVAADSMAHLASRVRMFTEEVSVFG
jgi:uncharacterized protein (TIGR02118 family)